MKQFFLIWLFVALLASAGLAASMAQGVRTEGGDADGEARYRTCLNLAERAPDKGIDNALAWQADGGGVPARHCEAIALAAAGEYGEAAFRLENLVEDMRIGRDMPVVGGKRVTADRALIADMFSQAANAWLLADEVGRAYDAIDAALSLVAAESPAEMAYLVDRARIAAADEDFSRAYADLTRVRVFDPGRRDILIFMASAARALGRFEEALTALEGYEATFPDDLTATLERGHLMDAMGDSEAARQAYLRVVETDPLGMLAELARANLERLDVNGRP